MSTAQYILILKYLAMKTIAAALSADYLPVGVNMKPELFGKYPAAVVELLFIGTVDFLRVAVTVIEINPGVLYINLFAENANDAGVIVSSDLIGDAIIDLSGAE